MPSFMTRLEGTLNQIRIKCPRRIADHEVPWHLKERLFHRVKKHIRDSVRYLYSNPQTTYSELVVTARRAQSETEETKVKAMSAATTEVPSSSKELGDQIARLMAALTRAEQGSCPASAPSSPRHRGRGRGWIDRTTSVCPNSHNGQMAWAKPPLLAALQLLIRQVSNPHVREIKMCRMVYRVVHKVLEAPTPCNASGVRVGATWPGSVQLWQYH